MAHFRRELLRGIGAAAAGGLTGCMQSIHGSGTSRREFPDRYYQGPLFLAHEHFISRGYKFDSDRVQWYVDFMDQNGVQTALPFIPSQMRPILDSHENRFEPFLADPMVAFLLKGKPVSAFPKIVEDGLSSGSSWSGIGEISLKALNKRSDKAIPADHPALREIYDIGAERDKVVMIHPRRIPSEYSDDPLSSPQVRELEAAFEYNRDTVFLVHGFNIVGDWIVELLNRHPNWYYDVSGQMTPHSWAQNEQLRDPKAFSEHMDRTHRAEHIERAYDRWQPVFERPKRVVVGFDMGLPWHLDDRVLNSWVSVFRGVLGRLSDAAARKVGHDTAKRVLAE